jgi:DMSO/TMAO reductase YedYZ molybdopterin-dependent catalytic subunit
VPLGTILQSAGILPNARFVNFYAYDGYMDSVDLLDAFHPQTILAYGMNGRDLPVPHGAPVRLRVETQIGYKSLKYLQRIVVTDQFVDMGDSGWAWYTGI